MSVIDSADDKLTAAVTLGRHIRTARKAQGSTIAEFAEKIDRPREWLNRIELGYSELGEYRPPSLADLSTIADCLGEYLDLSEEAFLQLGADAIKEFDACKTNVRHSRHSSYGKLTQTEVIFGEKQIVQAIVKLVESQPPDAIIRNTGIKSAGNYLSVSEEWKSYREALGKFLSQHPNALFKRIEYASEEKQLQEAKAADEKVAGSRDIKEVHNVKLKFRRQNPLQMHVVIGRNEAILALPQVSGLAGSNVALLIRDKAFIEALRVWYDEVLWDAPGASQIVDFSKFDSSFKDITKMYGLDGKE